MKIDYSDIKSEKEICERLKNPDFVTELSEQLFNLIGKVIDPFEEDGYIYDINQATIIGLYVKIYKYHKLINRATANKEYESCTILIRPLYEAFVIMKYLIKKGISSQTHYRLISYKNRFKKYEEFKNLDGLGKVLIDKLKHAMSVDGFNFEDFEKENTKTKGRKWSLDGKSFADIHKEVEKSETYAYMYGMTSEVIHSGWGEIRQIHVTHCEGDFFIPKMDFYNNVHFRMISSIISIIIDGTKAFLRWAERDVEIVNFNEIERINKLVFEHVYETYQSNPDKYVNE